MSTQEGVHALGSCYHQKKIHKSVRRVLIRQRLLRRALSANGSNFLLHVKIVLQYIIMQIGFINWR